jgi:ubiquinol-cytochrome c reductase cytochrome c1 subunit
MSMTRICALALASVAFSLAAASAASAAGSEARHPKDAAWSFDGPFGRYDADALQRGYQVYRQVCASCHGMSLVSFRNLGQEGGPFHLDACPEGFAEGVDCSNPNDNPIVKAIASEFQVQDGPNDFGEMFDRPGLPSDRFPKPFLNDQLARMANGGALPPDLSLIVKARPGGADYIYSLLSGFEPAPETVEVPPTQHYNPYFPGDMSQLLKPEFREGDHAKPGVEIPQGGVLAMAPPLFDGIVDYADPETAETVDQYSKDVTHFLAWAAEPKMEQRKKLGFMTVAYLLVLAGLLYWSYRSIWSKVEH